MKTFLQFLGVFVLMFAATIIGGAFWMAFYYWCGIPLLGAFGITLPAIPLGYFVLFDTGMGLVSHKPTERTDAKEALEIALKVILERAVLILNILIVKAIFF